MTKSELSYRIVEAMRENDQRELQRLRELFDKTKKNI